MSQVFYLFLTAAHIVEGVRSPPCPKLDAICDAGLPSPNDSSVQHMYPSQILKSSSKEEKLAGS